MNKQQSEEKLDKDLASIEKARVVAGTIWLPVSDRVWDGWIRVLHY